MADPTRGSASCEVWAEVLRRNWAVPLAAAAVAVAALVVVGRASPLSTIVALVVAIPAVVLAVGSLTGNAFPRARAIVLRASAVELVLGGDPPIAVEQIAEATIDSLGAKQATMTIALRGGGRRWLRMAGHDAAAVLRALGVSAGGRRARFAMMTPFQWRFLAASVVLCAPWLTAALRARGLPDAGAMVAGLVCFVAPTASILAWLMGWWWRGRLVVAADGIAVRWLFRERFIAFADMAGLQEAGNATNPSVPETSIELRSGRFVRLRAREVPASKDQIGAAGRALHAQLVEAFEAAKRRTTDAQSVAALLSGDGRSGAQWLAHLDAVMGGVARYRVAAPAPEALSTIANDPTRGTETRVAAAAVLARIDDAGRRTVRVAADACAEPRLRAALVSISEADSDEAFASALERVRRR